jgi:AcrR family transcriptional regulator
VKSDSLAPQQERSRKTLARLLDATVVTLESEGLKGATIPRIAAAAGVAAASVYRRFRDRDALLRAAFLAALERSARAEGPFEPAKIRTGSLDEVVAGLVAAISRQYREHPGLLRALIRFIETDTDEAFRKKVLGYIADSFVKAGDVLLKFRNRITHANPERAVLFGLLTVGTILEVRALEEVSMWHELLPISDEEMQAELTRSLLGYLRAASVH